MQLDPAVTVPPYLIWVIPDNIFNSFSATPRLEIAKEMRKLGWRVDLIASGANGRQVVQGIEVLCFPQIDMYLVRQITYHMHVVRYIFQNWGKIDVLLFHQASLIWFLPLRILNFFYHHSPQFVMDTRTVPMEPAEKATIRDRIRGKYSLIMNNLANRFADGQTAITQRMVDLLGIPREKLWGTWPSGVNKEKFSIARKERQWVGPYDQVNIIYVGSLHYERNLITLCKAVILANQMGMKFKLLLYGDGTEKNDLQSISNKYPGMINVFDSVPHDKIPSILSCAHVGVLPFPDEDKYRASSPIKLFEYMGAGLPILATRIACHTDVIGDGGYVFWAEHADVDGILNALREVWRARLLLADMGEKSLNAAGGWTYKSSAKQLSDALYHSPALNRHGELQETNVS